MQPPKTSPSLEVCERNFDLQIYAVILVVPHGGRAKNASGAPSASQPAPTSKVCVCAGRVMRAVRIKEDGGRERRGGSREKGEGCRERRGGVEKERWGGGA